jgi:hypothetical protein
MEDFDLLPNAKLGEEEDDRSYIAIYNHPWEWISLHSGFCFLWEHSMRLD